jgi:O-antigen/teichoic acid export membrane protein
LENAGSPAGRLATAIARNAIFNWLRGGAILVSGLATSVVVARALGPEEFGTYRLVLGLVWGLEVVSLLAFPSAVTRFIGEGGADSRRRAREVVTFYLATAMALYVPGLLALLWWREAIARFYHDAALTHLLLLGAVGVFPGLVAGLLGAVLRGRGRFRELNTASLVHSLLTVGATIALFALGFRLRALFVLLILLNVVQAALALGFARRDLAATGHPASGPPGLSARMRTYGVAMGAVALLDAVVWERSEVFFLGRFSTTEAVGFYSLAYTLALQAQRVLVASLAEVLFPVISHLGSLRDEAGLANAFVHATRYLAMIGFPLGLGGALFAAPLLGLLFGSAYLPAAPVLAILMLSAGAVALAHPAVAVIVSKERYRFLLAASALLAAANVGLDLLLIPRLGAVGAALANSSVQLLAVAIDLAFVSCLLAVRLPVGNLVRCLVASTLAFIPAALLAWWPVGGSLLALGLGGLTFLALYPLCLAALGVFVSEDVDRLVALGGRCPPGLRSLVGGLARLART